MRKAYRRDRADGVTITDAYGDLTREAFAVWVRMMVEPDNVLKESGINKLAERFRYKRRAFWEVLRQLRNKGYVRFETPVPGSPAVIYVTRRPMLVGYDRFIKLS